jgi:hypothetical protein
MRRTLTYILSLAIIIGFAEKSLAAAKKRDLDKREVTSDLRKFGGDHYFEDMKIRELGGIETDIDEEEDDGAIRAYYWIYFCELPDNAGYRVIIYDNEPRYLGYYEVTLVPLELGEESIVFDQGDSDMGSDPVTGETDRWSVKIPASGPPKRITMGVPIEFNAAPTIEEIQEKDKAARAAAAEEASSSARPSAKKKITPEYRSWTIKYGNKMITVESAIFVEYKGGMVTIKDAKTQRTVSRPLRDFSEEDQKYLRQLVR